MNSNYEIRQHGNQFVIYGIRANHVIIASATRQPLTFATREAAQVFVNINDAADRRHGSMR